MSARNILAGLTALTWLTALPAYAREWDVEQKGRVFLQDGGKIETLKIKAGDTIRFHNNDPFFHNIFSQTPGRPSTWACSGRAKRGRRCSMPRAWSRSNACCIRRCI